MVDADILLITVVCCNKFQKIINFLEIIRLSKSNRNSKERCL